jgi:CubicO group peptidase (beta-lactamase class C family)
MPSLLVRLATVSLTSAAGSFQSDLQEMLNEQASSAVGLQFGWKSASESFTIAAGSVTNPGESSRIIRPDDTFNYGSGTKTPIAAAIFRLADAGKIKTSDKVSTYVNPFLKRNNGTTLEELYGSQMADATILQVLRMEAGIPDFENAMGSSSIDTQALNSDGEVFTPYAWMRAAASQAAVCNPGACSFYSSNSYEVAGLLLTALQKPDGDWGDLDFGKAICGDSSQYPSMKLAAGQGKLKDVLSVSGVSRRSFSHSTILWDQNPSIMGWTCGGLMASTGDVAKFFYDLLAPSSPNPLVSDAARTEMSSLKVLNTGHFKVSYGAGLMDSAPPKYNKPTTKGPNDWGYMIGHIGETFAFHAINGYMPKAKAAFSIVTNTDSGFRIVDTVACKASEIAARYAGETVNLGCSSSEGGGNVVV